LVVPLDGIAIPLTPSMPLLLPQSTIPPSTAMWRPRRPNDMLSDLSLSLAIVVFIFDAFITFD
ncbi:hypothetical protein C8T65DRAFT_654190, partial [Cerioporus squamosus]